MKKNIFIALLFIGGLTACSDNNEGSDIPDNPGYPVTHFSKIELKYALILSIILSIQRENTS